MSDAPDPPAAPPRRRVLLVFVLLMTGFLGVIVEGGARLWSAFRERLDRASVAAAPAGPPLTPAQVEAAGRALGLDAYEMADPYRPGAWRLRPGYRASVSELLEVKRAAGRILTVRHMQEAAGRLGLAPDAIAVEVNADGFRGPALDASHRLYRILALGDSCTFGTPLSERYPYARVLERELRARGLEAEVVNGGVEGYSPTNVLARLPELRALRPEMTTLYIGWNELYRDRYLDDANGPRRYLHGARLLARALDAARERFGDRQKAASRALERPKRPDRNAAELQRLDGYVPPFLPDVVRIVEAMRAAGSRVVILTLPGLYATDREPSPRALRIGHLPTFTDNPFVLARMADRYNEALRTLARDRGLDLVDLDRWGRETLQPPDEHFIDSVHLDELSQERLGIHLADALAPLLPASARKPKEPTLSASRAP